MIEQECAQGARTTAWRGWGQAGEREVASLIPPPTITTSPTTASNRSTNRDIPTRIAHSFCNPPPGMTAIGSVFLGDVQRHRILSTSTPPSSPPPHLTMSPSALNQFFEISTNHSDTTPGPPPSVPPEVSLDLRVRWLETLLYGAKQDAKDKRKGLGDSRKQDTLVRGVEDIQKKLGAIVQTSEGLRRFMAQCKPIIESCSNPADIEFQDEQHSHLLTPSFALSGQIPTSPPPYDNMSPSELEAFLAEMEQDIRGADRDLREIDLLERKNVTAAGRLPEHEALKPRLQKLQEAHEEDLRLAAQLEKRIAGLMDRYATNVGVRLSFF